MTWHSSNGVDRYLVPLLPDFGYACEVGANDGIYGSNTKALEDKGWVVLCVEAIPDLAEIGRKNRRLWRQVAVSDHDAESKQFLIAGSYPWGGYSTLGEKSRYGYEGPLAPIQVKVRTVDRLLEEAGFPRLDYLSIDVEGWELEVLRGFTIERWNPLAVTFESRLDHEVGAPVGYRRQAKLEEDVVWLRDDMP